MKARDQVPNMGVHPITTLVLSTLCISLMFQISDGLPRKGADGDVRHMTIKGSLSRLSVQKGERYGQQIRTTDTEVNEDKTRARRCELLGFPCGSRGGSSEG